MIPDSLPGFLRCLLLRPGVPGRKVSPPGGAFVLRTFLFLPSLSLFLRGPCLEPFRPLLDPMIQKGQGGSRPWQGAARSESFLVVPAAGRRRFEDSLRRE